MPETDSVAATPARVTVVDIDMPFGSMFIFMLKWAFAAIPAMMVLAVLGFFVSAVFAALMVGSRL